MEKKRKEEIKKNLKPLIKECFMEMFFEEELLSNIISEVVKGLNQEKELLTAPTKKVRQFSENKQDKKVELVESARRNLIKELEKKGMKNIFENVDENRIVPATEGFDPLKDKNPNDPGIDISCFFK